MSSPFASVDVLNTATLRYALGTGTLQTDPITGLQYASQTSGEIQAYVKRLSNTGAENTELAPNPSSEPVRVYCVDPMRLPAGIGSGSVLGYEFTDTSVSPNRIQQGKLTIGAMRTSQFSVILEVLGDVFDGTLLLESAPKEI